MNAKFSTIFIGLVVAISTSFANAQEGGRGFFKKKPVEVTVPASTAAGSTSSIESAPKSIGSKVTPGWVIGGNSGSASAPVPVAPIPLPNQLSNGARPPPAAPMPIPQEKKQSAGGTKILAQASAPKQSPQPKVKKTLSKADTLSQSPVADASEAPIAIAPTARPAMAAASDPRAACSGQNFIVAIVCVSIKCELPNFKNHAECIKLRTQIEANRINSKESD